jgi:outer membrane scaffolding protein for murein synthesis (MipA/OmpV family)
MKRSLRTAGLSAGLVAGLLAVQGRAHAESGWYFRVGPTIGVAPPYEGANRDTLVPSVTFDLRSANSPVRYVPPDTGTTIAIVSNRYFEIGPVVRFREGRDGKGELEGFRNIRWAAEPGAYLDVWPVSWLRGHVEGRRGVVGHQGWVGDAGVDLIYMGEHWDASVGPRIGWGDGRYMQTYFGVTPDEAARSRFVNDVYTPGAGRRYTGVETSIAYNFDPRWRVTFDVGYQRLAKVAADSPIVRLAGSADQYMSSIGFSYAFHVGRR